LLAFGDTCWKGVWPNRKGSIKIATTLSLRVLALSLQIPLVIAVTCPVSVAVNFLGAFSLWKGFKTPAEGTYGL
jgi:hypothetical protein